MPGIHVSLACVSRIFGSFGKMPPSGCASLARPRTCSAIRALLFVFRYSNDLCPMCNVWAGGGRSNPSAVIRRHGCCSISGPVPIPALCFSVAVSGNTQARSCSTVFPFLIVLSLESTPFRASQAVFLNTAIRSRSFGFRNFACKLRGRINENGGWKYGGMNGLRLGRALHFPRFSAEPIAQFNIVISFDE